MSSTLAFGWMWGWCWPCFNSNLLCFLMELWKKYYNSGQNILRHLRKLVAKTHFGKSTHILPLKQAWECCYKFVWLRFLRFCCWDQKTRKKKKETIIASENKLFAAPYFPVIAKSSALCKGHPISAYLQNSKVLHCIKQGWCNMAITRHRNT